MRYEKAGLADLSAAGLELSKRSLSPESLRKEDKVKLGVTSDGRLHVWVGERHSDYFKKLTRSGLDSVFVVVTGNMFRATDRETGEVREGEIHIEFFPPGSEFTGPSQDVQMNVFDIRAAVVAFLKRHVEEPGKKINWTIESFKNRPDVIDPRTGKPH